MTGMRDGYEPAGAGMAQVEMLRGTCKLISWVEAS
jgi:hypothetical protein